MTSMVKANTKRRKPFTKTLKRAICTRKNNNHDRHLPHNHVKNPKSSSTLYPQHSSHTLLSRPSHIVKRNRNTIRMMDIPHSTHRTRPDLQTHHHQYSSPGAKKKKQELRTYTSAYSSPMYTRIAEIHTAEIHSSEVAIGGVAAFGGTVG